MRRPLNESLHVQMTLKVALSLAIFIATTVTGIITWSYGFQDGRHPQRAA